MNLLEISLFTILSLFNFQCKTPENSSTSISQINITDKDTNENKIENSTPESSLDTAIRRDIYDRDIIPASHLVDSYLGALQGKRVALCVNQTSTIEKTHLVDSLSKLGIQITKIFAPEHGFRGKADAGEHINNSVDPATGISIISLYGNHKKPTAEDLSNVDVIVFDIQDVGARFYTFISTLTYVMEAAAENDKSLIVLDRPNPNGHYIDGPVLEKGFESFVGMHQVPIVYGMTIGEYAQMVNGENWISKPCALQVITCANYNHKKFYELPIAPSPNLKSMLSIYLYPSLCLFEGTPVSVGRGTEKPFEIYGYPDMTSYPYSFKPKPTDGAKDPLQNGKVCYGEDLSRVGELRVRMLQKVNVSYLQNAYKSCNNKTTFFNNFFNKLSGNSVLKTQIQNNIRETDIRNSWENGLSQFQLIRKKYLLYEDFN